MADINNTSFEDAGAAPGEAVSWDVSLPYGAQDIAEFNSEPQEGFEAGFDNDESKLEFDMSDLEMCLFATHSPYQGGFMPRETFEFGWMEPQAPNYYGAPWNHDSHYRFEDENLELGLLEDFETSWGIVTGWFYTVGAMGADDSFESDWGTAGTIAAFTWPADPAQLELAPFGGADQENFSNMWTETFPS